MARDPRLASPREAIQQAVTLHRQGRLLEAANLYGLVLEREPGNFDAQHFLGVLKLQQGRPAEAAGLLEGAARRKPKDIAVAASLAAALSMLGRHEQALAVYDKVAAASPRNFDAWFNRGVVLANLGRQGDAAASYRKALTIEPNHPLALYNCANALAADGRYDDALACYAAALQHAPPGARPDILNNRGIVLGKTGRHAEALESYDGALAARPDHAEALSNRANALRKLARHDEALASCERALAIDPRNLVALVTRGNVLIELHRADAALADFDRALAVAPQDAEAHANRGIALFGLARHDEALAAIDRALALDPGHANAWFYRGHVLNRLRRHDEAAASYERTLALEAEHPHAFEYVAQAKLAACDWVAVEGLRGELLGRAAAGRGVISPFTAIGYGGDLATQLACARSYRRSEVGAMPALSTGARTRHDKVRLAYLSSDYRNHPVGQVMPGLIERHDRARFEVIGISYGPDDGSEQRARFAGAFDRFIDVAGRSDREAAGIVHELGIDIAIDLNNYSEHARPRILAQRPAPLAVAYLGYPATMAAEFIDYMIADRFVLPEAEQQFYTENIVYLPDTFFVRDVARKPSAPPTRAEAGLPEQAFVFCGFNNHFKITAPVFDIWMRWLAAIDGSVLWLSGAPEVTAANLRHAAQARGIDPSRIVFAPRLERLEDHFARQALADLFVDTLPYGAHTTAGDALWSGLPVLTCVGDSFPGRVAGSLLQAIGLPELITRSAADYEALGLALARDPAALGALRAKLAANRATGPLFDADRFRRHIEAAYLTMWEMWQAGEGPRGFAVAAE